jgi:hypothetical protein
LPNGLTNIYSSTKGDTIRITAGTIADTTYAAGTIKVTATNDCGPSEEQTSAKAVTVRDCSAAPTVTPVGTTNLEVKQTNSQSISVSANGYGALTLAYQWQSSTTGGDPWSNVSSNGTSNAYTVPTGTTGTFYYRCQVSNDCGKSTSGTYTITVKPLCTGYKIEGGVSGEDNNMLVSISNKDLDAIRLAYPELALDPNSTLCLDSTDRAAAIFIDAHRLCNDLTIDDVSTSTWRLPSISELGNLHANKNNYGFKSTNYWSAHQESGTAASWTWNFSSGTAVSKRKDNEQIFRCVRSLK